MIVEQLLQRLRIAAGIGLVGARHQQSEVLLLHFVACEVGMDAFCEIAKKGLKAWRRVIDFGRVVFAKRCFMRLMCAGARFLRALAGSVGIVEVHFALGDARFKVIELGVEVADLAEVAALECRELGAELCHFRGPLGKKGARRGKLRALVKQSGVRD